MDIHEIINKIYPIPETSMDKLTKHLSKVTYPKGHHILEAGKTETNIFFIEKGIVRAYIPVDGKEVTFWIGKEGSAIVSLKSYVDNQQGYESMELMEESGVVFTGSVKTYRNYLRKTFILPTGDGSLPNPSSCKRRKDLFPYYSPMHPNGI